ISRKRRSRVASSRIAVCRGGKGGSPAGEGSTARAEGSVGAAAVGTSRRGRDMSGVVLRGWSALIELRGGGVALGAALAPGVARAQSHAPQGAVAAQAVRAHGRRVGDRRGSSWPRARSRVLRRGPHEGVGHSLRGRAAGAWIGGHDVTLGAAVV